MSELLLVSNPKRRRKNPHRHHRRKNPHRSHRRRNPHRRYHRRRNPSFMGGFSARGLTGQIMPTFKAGLIGAGGAIGLDAAWGFLQPYLPSALNTSAYTQYAVKALTAVAVGMIGGKILRGKGTALAVGGMTVATHDLLKSVLQSMAPSMFGPGGTLSLGSYGAYLSGSAPIMGTATAPQVYYPFGESSVGSGMGAYLSGSSGMADGNGMYTDDTMGMASW